MKLWLVFVCFLLASCSKKEETTLGDVIDQCAGVYNCQRINFYWSNFQAPVFDTLPDEVVTVAKVNDRQISVNNTLLTYHELVQGNYIFLKLKGVEDVFSISQHFNSFTYRHEGPGQGGGSGYILKWTK